MKLFNNKTTDELLQDNSQSNHVADLLTLKRFMDTKSPALEDLAGIARESLGIPEDADLDQFFRTKLVQDTLNPVIEVTNIASTLEALELLIEHKEVITGDTVSWTAATTESLTYLCETLNYPTEILGYPADNKVESNIILEDFTSEVWVKLQDWWIDGDQAFKQNLNTRLEVLDDLDHIDNELEVLIDKAHTVDTLREDTDLFKDKKLLAKECREAKIFPVADKSGKIVRNIKEIITKDNTSGINELLELVDDNRLTTEQFDKHISHKTGEMFELESGKNDTFFALAIESIDVGNGKRLVRGDYDDKPVMSEISTNTIINDAMEMHHVCHGKLQPMQNANVAVVAGITKTISGKLSVKRIRLLTALLDQQESCRLIQENLLSHIYTTGQVLDTVEASAMENKKDNYGRMLSDRTLMDKALEVTDTESFIDFLSDLGSNSNMSPAILELSEEALNVAIHGNTDYYEEVYVAETTKPGMKERFLTAVARFVDRIVAAIQTAYAYLDGKITDLWKWALGMKPHVDVRETEVKNTKYSDFYKDKGDPVADDSRHKQEKPADDEEVNDNLKEPDGEIDDPTPADQPRKANKSGKTSVRYESSSRSNNRRANSAKRVSRSNRNKRIKKRRVLGTVRISHPKTKSGGPHIVKVGLTNMASVQEYLYGFYGKKLFHLYKDIILNYQVLNKLRNELTTIIKKYGDSDPDSVVLKVQYTPLHKDLLDLSKGKLNAPLSCILNKEAINVGSSRGRFTKEDALSFKRKTTIKVMYINDIALIVKMLKRHKDSFNKVLQSNSDSRVLLDGAVSAACVQVTTGAIGVIAAMGKVHAMEEARVRAIILNNSVIGQVQRGDYDG